MLLLIYNIAINNVGYIFNKIAFTKYRSQQLIPDFMDTLYYNYYNILSYI